MHVLEVRRENCVVMELSNPDNSAIYFSLVKYTLMWWIFCVSFFSFKYAPSNDNMINAGNRSQSLSSSKQKKKKSTHTQIHLYINNKILYITFIRRFAENQFYLKYMIWILSACLQKYIWKYFDFSVYTTANYFVKDIYQIC